MSAISLDIEVIRAALSRARAAYTTLTELRASPAHRDLHATQLAVVHALEAELAALRYAASHPVTQEVST